MSERLTNWEYICNSALIAQTRGETAYAANIDVLLDTDTELKRLRTALAAERTAREQAERERDEARAVMQSAAERLAELQRISDERHALFCTVKQRCEAVEARLAAVTESRGVAF